MKPTSLKPGDRVRFHDAHSSCVVTFERREPSESARSAVCWFRDANGVPLSAPDAFVARRGVRVEQESRPRG